MKIKTIIIGGISILSLIGMSGCSLDNANEVKVFDKQNNVISSNTEVDSNKNNTSTTNTEEDSNKNNTNTTNTEEGSNKNLVASNNGQSSNEKNGVGENNIDKSNNGDNKGNNTNTTETKVVDVSFNLVQEEYTYAIIWGYNKNGDVVWKYQTQKDEAAQFDNARYFGTRGNNVYITDLGRLKILDLQTGKEKATSENKPGDKSAFFTAKEIFGDEDYGDNNLYLANEDALYIVDTKGNIKEIKLDIPYMLAGMVGDDPWYMCCIEDDLSIYYEIIEQSSEYKEGYTKSETVDSVYYEKLDTLMVNVNLNNYDVTMKKNGESLMGTVIQ